MQRQINKSGDITLPVSFIGKTVEVEVEVNGRKIVFKKLVKARGFGAYITLSRKLTNKIATVNTKDLFKKEELEERYKKGEYLSKGELVTLIDAHIA